MCRIIVTFNLKSQLKEVELDRGTNYLCLSQQNHLIVSLITVSLLSDNNLVVVDDCNTFFLFCCFMDPRIAWPTPEQIGPAYKYWLSLWELATKEEVTSQQQEDTNSGVVPNIMRNDTNNHHTRREEDNTWEKQQPQDFIPLTTNSKSSVLNTYGGNGRKEYCVARERDSSNKASTYGFNHSSKLDIFEKHKLMPWLKKDKCYSSNYMMR